MASFKITFVLFAVILATAAALPKPAPQNIASATKNAPAVADDLEASEDLKGAESVGYGYYGGLGYPSYYSGYPYGLGYGGYGGYRSYYPSYYSRSYGGLYGLGGIY